MDEVPSAIAVEITPAAMDVVGVVLRVVVLDQQAQPLDAVVLRPPALE
jgi:hypothetical protein